MYSTCLFCNADLGRNEALYDFPVGRRIAFDSRKGRLWVVCRQCERWNLTPIEERWEAIEEAERRFRAAWQRLSTENIGLTRLPDRTELVRIGEPLRPEYAAWRYGDQFGRRRRRQILIASGGLGAIGALLASGAMAGVSVAVFGGLIGSGINSALHGNPERIIARIRTEGAGKVAVRRRHLAETRLERGTEGPLAVELRYKGGAARLEGREALRVAGTLMPHVNRYGGKHELVKAAAGALDDAGGAEGFVERMGKFASDWTAVPLNRTSTKRKARRNWGGAFTSGLFGLDAPDRLALEMALHEEAEMRALRGELAELERAWRDAEEIAEIADDLLMPSSIQRTVERIRRLAQ